MSTYSISPIYPGDRRGQHDVDALLQAEGIRRDQNLDYTCGIYDEQLNLIATGSCFHNTLRCLAVSSMHQGEGLMNDIITHLWEFQYSRGNYHLFLYTKCNSSHFFEELGFYEIARVDQQLVFMENKKHGFFDYLEDLKKTKKSGANIAALVMNANPFTFGHQYLIEKAASENEVLHLFIVSEDASLFPFSVRKQLVMEGTAHITNVCYHDCGPYIISNATFPSYFQKDEAAVIEGHALLDLTIFNRIADTLGIRRRYVGEEPYSQVTGIYNQMMQTSLPAMGIECIVVPRLEVDGQVISASIVRQALKDNNPELLTKLVPKTTLDYLLSHEAAPVIEKIRAAKQVIHY